jgi:hypothetical protein
MQVWRIPDLPSCNKVTPANCRKGSKLLGLCVAAFLLNGFSATRLVGQEAQAKDAAPAVTVPAHTTHPTHRSVTLDDRVKGLTAALNLNEAQQAAVKKILEQRHQETLRIARDPSIPGSDRIGRLRALQDQTVERIRAVLNDEQKKKYDPLAVRKVTPAPEQKSVEDWLKVTNPQ